MKFKIENLIRSLWHTIFFHPGRKFNYFHRCEKLYVNFYVRGTAAHVSLLFFRSTFKICNEIFTRILLTVNAYLNIQDALVYCY